MPSHPDAQYRTAKKMSIQKFGNPAPSMFPYGPRGARQARDLKSGITSNMTNTTPYDRTTPPRVQTIPKSPILRPSNFPAIVNPRHTSPAAACLPTPHLTLRGGRNVTQNDGHSRISKRHAPPGPNSPASRDTLDAVMGKHRSVATRRPTPFEHCSPLYRDVSPLPITAVNTIFPVVTPMTVAAETTRTASTESIESTEWAETTTEEKAPTFINPFGGEQPKSVKPYKVHVVKLPAEEVFDMSFSFARPSRRRACDRALEVSPRTSFSFESDNDLDKRQRIDSSDTPSDGFSWLGPFIRHSSCTRASKEKAGAPDSSDEELLFLGASSPRSSYAVRHHDIPSSPGPHKWDREDLSSYPFVHTRTEAHPGNPVDFRAPTRDNDIFGSASPPYELEPESYHTYLRESCRRNSLHTTRRSRPRSASAPTCQRNKEQVTKGAQVLGLTAAYNVPGRKRAAPASSNVSMASARSGSSASDPSSERFLMHVRASQEARAMRKAQERGRMKSVFRDERETGWFELGEGPL